MAPLLSLSGALRPSALHRLGGRGAKVKYSFFVLTEGAAEITVAGDVLRSLGPGDFFGEIGILVGGRRTATVTATSEAMVLVLFGTEFRRLQEELPGPAASIEAAMQRTPRRSTNARAGFVARAVVPHHLRPRGGGRARATCRDRANTRGRAAPRPRG
jgi:CRP-like cAMP-binding protein